MPASLKWQTSGSRITLGCWLSSFGNQIDQNSSLIMFYSYNLATQVDTGRLEIVIILFRRGYLPIEINEINMDNKNSSQRSLRIYCRLNLDLFFF